MEAEPGEQAYGFIDTQRTWFKSNGIPRLLDLLLRILVSLNVLRRSVSCSMAPYAEWRYLHRRLFVGPGTGTDGTKTNIITNLPTLYTTPEEALELPNAGLEPRDTRGAVFVDSWTILSTLYV